MSIVALHHEQELLAGISGGDHHAFRLIYDHYRPLVYSFSLKYLQSKAPSEEIVQETFLKLWRMGHQLLQIDDLESYIFTMARNRCFDTLRRTKLEIIYNVPLTAEMDYHTNETEESILLRDTQKILEEAIALLPPQQQLVYQLCHVKGRKQSEVAKQLQLSPETVKRHMKLALKFLRQYINTHTDLTIILIILRLI